MAGCVGRALCDGRHRLPGGVREKRRDVPSCPCVFAMERGANWPGVGRTSVGGGRRALWGLGAGRGGRTVTGRRRGAQRWRGRRSVDPTRGRAPLASPRHLVSWSLPAWESWVSHGSPSFQSFQRFPLLPQGGTWTVGEDQATGRRAAGVPDPEPRARATLRSRASPPPALPSALALAIKLPGGSRSVGGQGQFPRRGRVTGCPSHVRSLQPRGIRGGPAGGPGLCGAAPASGLSVASEEPEDPVSDSPRLSRVGRCLSEGVPRRALGVQCLRAPSIAQLRWRGQRGPLVLLL